MVLAPSQSTTSTSGRSAAATRVASQAQDRVAPPSDHRVEDDPLARAQEDHGQGDQASGGCGAAHPAQGKDDDALAKKAEATDAVRAAVPGQMITSTGGRAYSGPSGVCGDMREERRTRRLAAAAVRGVTRAARWASSSATAAPRPGERPLVLVRLPRQPGLDQRLPGWGQRREGGDQGGQGGS